MRIACCLILGLACGGKAGPGWTGIAQALQRAEAPRTTSVLVLRGHAIVYEPYFQGATAATLHDTRSATKSLTALAVGIAIDRHALPGRDATGRGPFHQASCATAATRTNYNTKGMHQQTTKLIEDQILPALACAR